MNINGQPKKVKRLSNVEPSTWTRRTINILLNHAPHHPKHLSASTLALDK